jgi:hypothetical protein
MRLQQTAEGTIMEIKAKPKSKEFSVKQNHEIIVLCLAPPIKGKANKEIIKNLQKIFNKKIEIISGSKSKIKKILIRNCKLKEVEKILREIES